MAQGPPLFNRKNNLINKKDFPTLDEPESIMKTYAQAQHETKMEKRSNSHQIKVQKQKAYKAKNKNVVHQNQFLSSEFNKLAPVEEASAVNESEEAFFKEAENKEAEIVFVPEDPMLGPDEAMQYVDKLQ